MKHVDLPPDMQRAMARQAEAEREKRAKIIHAAGELQASEKLAQAAGVIATEPMTITLRYLQTLTEIASEKNSTIIFPLPIELMNHLDRAGTEQGVSVPELTHDTPEDGFHEIQLSGKQLVFLFMVTTVVSVVIFLCGVLVGRDVRAERGRRRRPMAAAASPAPRRRAAERAGAAGRRLTRPRRSPKARADAITKRLQGDAAAEEKLEAGGAAAARPGAAGAGRPAAGTGDACRLRRAASRPAGRPDDRPAGHLGRPGHRAAESRQRREHVVQRLIGKGYPAFLDDPRRHARRSTASASAATTTARSRTGRAPASRRKSNSSRHHALAAPLGSAARAELPEVRSSRVRLDRADAAHRRRRGARRSLRDARSSSGLLAGVRLFLRARSTGSSRR